MMLCVPKDTIHPGPKEASKATDRQTDRSATREKAGGGGGSSVKNTKKARRSPTDLLPTSRDKKTFSSSKPRFYTADFF